MFSILSSCCIYIRKDFQAFLAAETQSVHKKTLHLSPFFLIKPIKAINNLEINTRPPAYNQSNLSRPSNSRSAVRPGFNLLQLPLPQPAAWWIIDELSLPSALFSVSLSISLSKRCHSSTASSGRDNPPPSCPVSTCCRLSAGKTGGTTGTAAGKTEPQTSERRTRMKLSSSSFNSSVHFSCFIDEEILWKKKRETRILKVSLFVTLRQFCRVRCCNLFTLTIISTSSRSLCLSEDLDVDFTLIQQPFSMILSPFQNHFGAINFFCEEIKIWNKVKRWSKQLFFNSEVITSYKPNQQVSYRSHLLHLAGNILQTCCFRRFLSFCWSEKVFDSPQLMCVLMWKLAA